MPWRKGLRMLLGLLQRTPFRQEPEPPAPLPITPERERRRICEEQQERKRRLAILMNEASVFRQEPHEQ